MGIPCIGDDSVEIAGVSPLTLEAEEGLLLYLGDRNMDVRPYLSKAKCFLINEKLREKVEIEAGKAYFFHEKAEGYFYKILALFKESEAPSEPVHESEYEKMYPGASVARTAVVEKGVKIGSGSVIAAGVYLSRGTVIGDETKIGVNSVILSGAKIGSRCVIGSCSVIGGEGFGYDEELRKKPHLGSVHIEDDVEIGSNSCVDRAMLGVTKIGKNTKIDNLVQIAHNVEIGESCLIVSQVGIAGSCRIGSRVTVLGQVGIGDHVWLEDDIKVYPRTAIFSNSHFKKGVNLIDAPAKTTDEAREDFWAERNMLKEYKEKLRKEKENKRKETL